MGSRQAGRNVNGAEMLLIYNSKEQVELLVSCEFGLLGINYWRRSINNPQ